MSKGFVTHVGTWVRVLRVWVEVRIFRPLPNPYPQCRWWVTCTVLQWVSPLLHQCDYVINHKLNWFPTSTNNQRCCFHYSTTSIPHPPHQRDTCNPGLCIFGITFLDTHHVHTSLDFACSLSLSYHHHLLTLYFTLIVFRNHARGILLSACWVISFLFLVLSIPLRGIDFHFF